jgi:predicted RNA-binding protein YlqC (UPF0109 family)
MKDLLNFLISKMTGLEEYGVEETTDDGFVKFEVSTKPEEAGLLIGKKGKTIKTIRNLLKVRATLEKKGVGIFVKEK